MQGQERQAQGCWAAGAAPPLGSCQHRADVPTPTACFFQHHPLTLGVSLQASLPPTLASSCDQLGPKESLVFAPAV